MKQHFKYVFVKIIRLSNGMKVNQICSYVWCFCICSQQNNLIFSIYKCSSFLLVQMAKGCFCSAGTGIPPLSVHSLPVEGLYQESCIHKGLYFKLLFKFLSFLNDVERLQFCGPERFFSIRTAPSTPLQMTACTLVSNPCQCYLCKQNLDLLFEMDAEYCRWSTLLP